MENNMRDRLIDLIRQSHCVDVWDYDNDDFIQPNPIETLADYLIANDVVPVVRCKDCKHYDIRNARCLLHSELADQYSSGFNFEMYSNDYCSYGEQKL